MQPSLRSPCTFCCRPAGHSPFCRTVKTSASSVVVPQGSAVVVACRFHDPPSVRIATSCKPQTKCAAPSPALVLLLITIPIGLAVRFLPLGLPWFLYKYLGSFSLGDRALLVPRALFSKAPPASRRHTLHHSSPLMLDLSRLVPIAPSTPSANTFPGQILLGRFFSIKNIAAYIVAIALVAALDHASSRATCKSSHPPLSIPPLPHPTPPHAIPSKPVPMAKSRHTSTKTAAAAPSPRSRSVRLHPRPLLPAAPREPLARDRRGPGLRRPLPRLERAHHRRVLRPQRRLPHHQQRRTRSSAS